MRAYKSGRPRPIRGMSVLRLRVAERAQGRDEATGKPLLPHWELHHRQYRSRGGKDVLDNLVALNQATHAAEHSHDSGRGFVVASWENPLAIPILHHELGLVLLTNEGTYAPTEVVS